MAATLTPQLSSKSISTDPEGPRVLKSQVSWAEKEPCSPTSTTSTLTSSWLERLRSTMDTDPGPKYDPTLPSPSFFKILQVFVSVVTAGLYSEGIKAMRACVALTTMMIPYLVTSNYLIVTPIVLISYVLGHRMPEILVRIFNLLAVILFITAGAVCMQGWHHHSSWYREDLKAHFNQSLYQDQHTTTEKQQASLDFHKNGIMLFAAGVCCFFNSMIYAGDIAWSVYTSLTRT